MSSSPDVVGRADRNLVQAGARPGGPRAHCLIVDDDEDIRFLVSHTLTRHGVTFRKYSNAQAAVDSLDFESPSVIFLDVALEGADAVDVLRWLGQRGYEGAVQIISGHDASVLDNIRKIGERHGLRMRAPIKKPFRAAAIVGVIEEEGLLRAKPAPEAAAAEQPADAKTATIEQRPRASLREAMRHGWVEFWYHPKMDVQNLRLVGAEALARVRHPEFGIIEPCGFLQDAGEVELAVLGGLAMETALADWPIFARNGLNLKLAVNMSAASLDIMPVASLIRQYPQPENWPGLILEVTERDVINDMTRMHELAIQLGLYRVSLSIDDFGRGFASLALLRDLPFKELKLDRGFVQNCGTDERNRGICQGVIDMAHRVGASVVAEGIETAAELKALVQMGCDFGQGYVFSRPLERDRLIAWGRALPQKTSPLVPAE